MIHVLYHAGCCDGFASAFAVWLTHGVRAQHTPVKYGDPIPLLNPSRPSSPDPIDVLITDFSYPARDLLSLANRDDIRFVTVLDHHEGAAAELSPERLPKHEKLSVRFDMAKCGAVLTWEHLYPGRPVPEMFNVIQDYDLWRLALPDTLRLITGLWRGVRRKFDHWLPHFEEWQNGGRQRLITAGAAILQSDDQSLYILERGAIEITGPAGQRGLSVNTPNLKNDIAERILQSRPDIVSVWHESGGQRSVSLRSRQGGTCDVAAIAAHYGGGGHPTAAAHRHPAAPLTSHRVPNSTSI